MNRIFLIIAMLFLGGCATISPIGSSENVWIEVREYGVSRPYYCTPAREKGLEPVCQAANLRNSRNLTEKELRGEGAWK